MIVQETIKIDGKEFVKTYSDEGFYIIQNETGNQYEEAVDIPNMYTYSESEDKIGEEQEPEPIEEVVEENETEPEA